MPLVVQTGGQCGGGCCGGGGSSDAFLYLALGYLLRSALGRKRVPHPSHPFPLLSNTASWTTFELQTLTKVAKAEPKEILPTANATRVGTGIEAYKLKVIWGPPCVFHGIRRGWQEGPASRAERLEAVHEHFSRLSVRPSSLSSSSLCPHEMIMIMEVIRLTMRYDYDVLVLSPSNYSLLLSDIAWSY